MPRALKGGRFRIVRRLGEGGMGVVYEAYDAERRENVALKTLAGRDPGDLLRLKTEFRTLSQLHHPNLVSLGELYEDDGRWFFTMELLDAEHLTAYVRRGRVEAHDLRTVSATTWAREAGARSEEEALPPAGTAGACDLDRLRHTLAQLGAALDYLHGAGKVHRDLKPGNVLVDRDGRVVVLDFGVAADAAPSWDASEAPVVGTAAYMAPEQAASRAVGPAADLYAVGVMLFEALTGVLPFDGPPLAILAKKQHAAAPAPSSLVGDVPPELDALCLDLLRFDPEARPGAADLRARALARPSARGMPPAPRSHPSRSATSFVGRDDELRTLAAGLARARAGGAVAVTLRGESGVGKSALARAFTDALARERPRVVVLQGRCFEHEAVPFRAIDGVVDALSTWLARLGEGAARFVPTGARRLVQIFPVLGRIDAFAAAEPESDERIDPREARARVFAALRELMARLTAEATVVISVDDVQWADADSLLLLSDLLRAPGAPPILVLATERTGDAAADAPSRLEPIRRAGCELWVVPVDRLPAEDAELLARALLAEGVGRGEELTADAEVIAREAAGHPLFLHELVRHAARGSRGPAPPKVEDALRARYADLDAESRKVLEVIAVAATPLAPAVLARAVGAPDREGLARRVGALRVASLVRSAELRDGTGVEPYHDRVRSAVLGALDEATARGHHRRLAFALEAAANADPEVLTVHYRAAGELERAAFAALRAAHQAQAALAFDRAARLYAAALELGTYEPDALVGVVQQLGDALASAGRSAEAARAYLRAAETAPHEEALDLRRRAAGQLLLSGHIEEGLAVVRGVLEAVGLSYPSSTARALASLTVGRVRLAMRGTDAEPRKKEELSPALARRIDACWSVGIGLAVVDPLRGWDFHVRGLLLALESGDPFRIARALALHAAFASASGAAGRRKAAALAASARRHAATSGDTHAVAIADAAHGMLTFFAGEWAAARELTERSARAFRERCVGAVWELAATNAFLVQTLFYGGDYLELARLVPGMLRSAEERGDLFTRTNLRVGEATILWSARGTPEAGLRDVDDAIRAWARPGTATQQHAYALSSKVGLHLYRGDGAAAWGEVERTWADLMRSRLTRVTQISRIALPFVRARAALGAAAVAGAGSAARARHLREAEQCAATIARERIGWAHAEAALVRAGAAALAGRDDAAEAFARAAEALEAAGMQGHAAVARVGAGTLRGGADGHSGAEEARARLRAQGVLDPDAFAQAFVPFR